MHTALFEPCVSGTEKRKKNLFTAKEKNLITFNQQLWGVPWKQFAVSAVEFSEMWNLLTLWQHVEKKGCSCQELRDLLPQTWHVYIYNI